jgi:hypothetical protein
MLIAMRGLQHYFDEPPILFNYIEGGSCYVAGADDKNIKVI